MIFQEILAFFANPVNWTGSEGIPIRLIEHIMYTVVAVIIAIAIALPLGTILGHTRKGAWLIIALANASRALPTLGLLTLMVLVIGLGFAPAAIVLVVLAIPPILTASYAGVKGVDPYVVDAARGIGMPEWRIVLEVELPIAAQVLVGGIRSAMLQVIATATVAAYIALGGLGRFLLDGLALRDYGQMAAGAVLVALLAIATDGIFSIVNKLMAHKARAGAKDVADETVDPESTVTRMVRTGGSA